MLWIMLASVVIAYLVTGIFFVVECFIPTLHEDRYIYWQRWSGSRRAGTVTIACFCGILLIILWLPFVTGAWVGDRLRTKHAA